MIESGLDNSNVNTIIDKPYLFGRQLYQLREELEGLHSGIAYLC